MAHNKPGWLDDYLKERAGRDLPEHRTTVPDLIGGARQTTYTGAGPRNERAMVDNVEYHKDEIVVPGTSVHRMGGPKRAMNKIRRLSGEPPKTLKMQTGGAVLTEKQKLEGLTKDTLTPEYTGLPGTTQQIKLAPVASAPEETLAPPSAPGTTLTAKQKAEGLKAEDLTPEYTGPPAVAKPAKADEVQPAYQPEPTAKQEIEGAEPPPAPELNAEQIAARNWLTQKYGRELTPDEMRWVQNSTSDQMRSLLKREGAPVGEGPKDVATSQAAATVARDAGIDVGKFDLYAQQAIQFMRDIATGDSDMMTKQANIAFQNLDARLQTQMMLTSMRLSNNPFLTEGAKTTLMAQEFAKAGVLQSELAGKLAENAINASIQAMGQVYSFATGERAYQMGQKQKALDEAYAAKDYDSYARISNEIYGTNIDPATLKSEQALKDVAKGNEFIATTFTQFPEADLTTDGMRTALQLVWNAQNPGEPMDQEWASDYLANFAKTMSPSYQFMQGMDESSALAWFGGDQGKLAKFSYGGKKGIDGFREAMWGFMNGGAYSMDEDGFFTFNEDSPIYQTMMETMGVAQPPDGLDEPLSAAQIAARNALVTKLGRDLTADELVRLRGSTPYKLDQWLVEEGVKEETTVEPGQDDIDFQQTPSAPGDGDDAGADADADAGAGPAAAPAPADSFAPTNLDRQIATGVTSRAGTNILYDPDTGENIVSPVDENDMRLIEGNIAEDVVTGEKYKITSDGWPVALTMTIGDADYNIIQEDIFENWDVVRDPGTGEISYRESYVMKDGTKVDELRTFEEVISALNKNKEWRRSPEMIANLEAMLEKGGELPADGLEEYAMEPLALNVMEGFTVKDGATQQFEQSITPGKVVTTPDGDQRVAAFTWKAGTQSGTVGATSMTFGSENLQYARLKDEKGALAGVMTTTPDGEVLYFATPDEFFAWGTENYGNPNSTRSNQFWADWS